MEKFKDKETQQIYDLMMSQKEELHKEFIAMKERCNIINERCNLLAKENEKLRVENERARNLGFI